MNPISIEFDDTAEEADELARSLARWLDDDETLTGATRLRLAPPAAGEQGGMADAAQLLVTAKPMIDALISGVFVWLTQRVRSRRVKLKITRRDGQLLEYTVGNIDDARALEGQLARFLDEDGTGGDGTSGDGTVHGGTGEGGTR